MKMFIAAICGVFALVHTSAIASAQSVTATTGLTNNTGEIVAKSTATAGGNYNPQSVYYQIGTVAIVNGIPVFTVVKTSPQLQPNTNHTFTGLVSGTQYQIRANATFSWAGPGAPPAGTPPTKTAQGIADRIAP